MKSSKSTPTATTKSKKPAAPLTKKQRIQKRMARLELRNRVATERIALRNAKLKVLGEKLASL